MGPCLVYIQLTVTKPDTCVGDKGLGTEECMCVHGRRQQRLSLKGDNSESAKLTRWAMRGISGRSSPELS